MLASKQAVPMPRPGEPARRIAELLLRHQRRAGGGTEQQGRRGLAGPPAPGGSCGTPPCPRCVSVQAAVVEEFVRTGRPVRLILPAFPGKSPNRAKVLGALPDMAEETALRFLDSLAESVRSVHPPGAEMVICSDGRVFSDAVGIPDDDITAYHRELRRMIAGLPHGSLSLFTLDEAQGFAGLGHQEMRTALTRRHAVPLERLRSRVRAGADVTLYRAVTRFLFEDGNTPEYTGSRAALQRDARARAYVVIQRSKAWGDFLACRFPGAVRLSIHPQPCSAAKLGVQLGESTDTWLTPWHGVAVEADGRMLLMKRAEAERLGCEVAERAGRPSHYVLRRPARPARPQAREEAARLQGPPAPTATAPAAPEVHLP